MAGAVRSPYIGRVTPRVTKRKQRHTKSVATGQRSSVGTGEGDSPSDGGNSAHSASLYDGAGTKSSSKSRVRIGKQIRRDGSHASTGSGGTERDGSAWSRDPSIASEHGIVGQIRVQ